jgi:hypothetical protein
MIRSDGIIFQMNRVQTGDMPSMDELMSNPALQDM